MSQLITENTNEGKKPDPRTDRARAKYEGTTYLTKEGNSHFIIKEFDSAANVIIEFPDYDGLTMRKSMYQISQGIPDPFAGGKVLLFKDAYSEYINTSWLNNDGDCMTVIAYNGSSKVTVRFNDEFGYTTVTTMQNIKKGQVLNPYHRNKFGGYLGEGPYISKGAHQEIYRRWYNMLMRAQDPAYYNEYHGIYKTDAYNNTMIDPVWLNYNAFAAWYVAEMQGLNPNYSYDIDKDLLYRFYAPSTNGMKCYGPNCCVIIPHDLNNKLQCSNLKTYDYSIDSSLDNFSSGKATALIKNAAAEYYKDGAISERVYNIIVNG